MKFVNYIKFRPTYLIYKIFEKFYDTSNETVF